MESDPTHVGSGGEHPSDAELAALAWGGTAVGVALSEHLRTCARCAAIVARSGGAAATAVGTLASAETVSATRASAPVVAVGLGPGTMIGRYRIEATLGQGGMGVVYRATDTELDRPVALKLVKASSSSVAELTERLRRESRLQARASHPSVITVHDIGIDGERVYVAMELASGGTLRAWLAAAPRPWREIVDVFRRAGEGLAAAHAAGLVHRDFKPDNVLIDVRDGRVSRVLVSDFGVARALEGAERAPGTSERVSAMELTSTGELIGTPAYMSPEQLRGDSVDARTDIFAFGVALWEALHGERPFRASTIAELVIALEVPPAPASDAAKLPRWLDTALRRMIAIDPARRFASMAELLAELERGMRRRRGPAIVAAAGVLALLLVGGLVAYGGGDGEEEVDLCEPARDPHLGAALVEAGARFAKAEVPAGYAALRDRWVAGVRHTGEAITGMRAETCALPRPSTGAARVHCLDAAAAQFVALVERGVQLEAAQRGFLVESIPPLVPLECVSDVAAAATAKFPGDELRDVVTALRLELTILQQRQARDPEVMEGIAARIHAVRFPALHHELAYLRAMESKSADRMRDVGTAAERDGVYHVAASAWQWLVEDTLEVSEQRARDRLAQAEIALRRAGEPGVQLATHHALRARLAALRGDVASTRSESDAAQQVLRRIGSERALVINLHLAVSEVRIGDFGRAVARYEALNSNFDQHPRRAERYLAELLMVRNGYAAALLGVGRPEDALHILELIVAQVVSDGPHRDQYATALSQVLLAYVQLGRYEEAAREAPRSIAMIDQLANARAPSRALARTNHATALLALERYAEAEHASREALERMIENQGRAHYDTADVRVLHAQALMGLRRHADALEEAERGYLDLAQAGDASDPLVMQGRLVFARALVAAGRPADALPHLEATLEPFRAVVPAEEAARQDLVLAEALVALRRDKPRAKALATRAVEVLSKASHAKEDLERARRLLRALR